MLSELRKAIDEVKASGREIQEIIVDEKEFKEELNRYPVMRPPGTEINKVFGYPLKIGNVNQFEIVLE
jgi:hypothetical protein